LKDLEVEQICTDNNQIDWVITNPNSFEVKVDWTLKDDGNNTVASGTGDSVGAGATLTLHTTALGVYTLTVHITEPFISQYFNLTSDQDTCYVPDSLTLENACELDQAGKPTGRIVWTVNNPNDREITFDVNGANPVEAGPYSAPANGSATFTTGNDSALAVTVSFGFGDPGETFTSNEVTSEAGECEAPPLPLTLGYACELVQGRYTGNVLWTVNNPNGIALQFTVDGITTVESQPIDIAALSSATFTTDDTVDASVTVTFSYGDPSGDYASEAVQLTAFECTEPQDIYITYYCELDSRNGEDLAFGSAKNAKLLPPGSSIFWYVVNPNPFAVDVEVLLDGSSQGNFTIPAYGSQQFSSESGSHTLEANWDGDQSTSSTSEIDACVPPQPLQLSYVCLPGSGGAIAWSVYNPNIVPVAFDYYLDQDPPVSADGNAVVGAGETMEFAITSGGAHLGSIAWLYGGENLLSEASPSDYCLPPDGGGEGGDPLPPPGAAVGGSGGAVLIPVTGADRSGMLQSWFINLGLVFLGAAIVLTALTRRLATRPV
jgi:hypothetical protein